jgi:5-methylcytosine-specific restriction endonuclease McrA
MSDSVVSEKTYMLLLVRDQFMCLKCGNTDDLQPAHYISRGDGGSDALSNLMLLCNECHRAHHDGKLKVRRVLVDNTGLIASMPYKFFFSI